MSDPVINLSTTDEHIIYQEMCTPPHEKDARLAIKYIFQRFASEKTSSDRLKNNKAAARQTINEIVFRYDLFNEFADNFFKGRFNRKSLMLAIICDGKIHELNCHGIGDEEKTILHSQFFDDVDVEPACKIWDEAAELMVGLFEENNPYSKESFFLAHVQALEKLKKVEAELGDEDFDTYSEDDIISLMADLEAMREFVRTDTQIGSHLDEYLKIFEDRLYPYTPQKLRARDPYLPVNDI